MVAGLLLVSAGPLSAARAEGVGVATFEVVPSGQQAPELGVLLANRLATRGVGRVAGPSELGAPARFEPAVAEVQGWARAAAVDAIVVGRTTRVGSAISVHAKLIDGVSGKPVGKTVVQDAARPEELGRAIDGLTASLLDRLAERPGAVSAPAPAAKPTPKPRTGATLDRSKPLSIQSDELEAAPDANGRRRLTFVGHVRARQGELSLDSDRLEAFYPAGASEPEKLAASGHVTIRQADRLARCAEAVFYRSDERVVCSGELAEIEQACDLLRSPRITFHLNSERLEAAGPVDVKIRPDGVGCGVAAASGAPVR